MILVELASIAVLGTAAPAGFNPPTPGFGIRYLAILDLLLAWRVATMALGLILPRADPGPPSRASSGLILSLLGLLAAIVLIFLALGALILMVSLLLAVASAPSPISPSWGHFPEDRGADHPVAGHAVQARPSASAWCCAHQRSLQNKGLVILAAVSLGATWVMAFLHSFPPGLSWSASPTSSARW